MSDYYVKQGDDSESLTAVLVDRLNVAVNLTGATVKMYATHAIAGTLAVNATVTVNADQINHRGEVTYAFAAGGLTVPGEYLVEWEVTFAGGKKQTFPNDGYSIITVVPQLA
jgi:hypothetical protein